MFVDPGVYASKPKAGLEAVKNDETAVLVVFSFVNPACSSLHKQRGNSLAIHSDTQSGCDDLWWIPSPERHPSFWGLFSDGYVQNYRTYKVDPHSPIVKNGWVMFFLARQKWITWVISPLKLELQPYLQLVGVHLRGPVNSIHLCQDFVVTKTMKRVRARHWEPPIFPEFSSWNQNLLRAKCTLYKWYWWSWHLATQHVPTSIGYTDARSLNLTVHTKNWWFGKMKWAQQ